MRPYIALIIAGAITLAVIFSGCIQVEDTESRALCLKLSVYPETGIPNCLTTEDCFQKAGKSIFSFPQENFSYALRQKISSMQNHVALSWLFLNRSKANLNKMNLMCSNRSYAGLTTEVNDFKYNSINASNESDSAALDSFSSLLIAASDLESQKLGLAKEEGAYNDLSELRNAVSDLKSKNPRGNSFVSKYFQVSAGLEEFEKRIGLAQNAQHVTLLGALDYYDNPILEKYSKDGFYLKLLGSTASIIVSYFSSFEKLRQASLLLDSSPANDFFPLISGLVSPGDSVSSAFSSMFSGISQRQAALISKRDSLKSEAISLISSAEEKVNQLSGKSVSSRDENVFASLYSLLGAPSIISAKVRELDPYAFSEQAKSKIISLRRRLATAIDGEFFSTMPLGQQVSEFKEIRIEAISLKSEADYYSEEIVSGLESLCESRAKAALEEISSMKGRPESLLLADLKARTGFRVREMRSKEGTAEYFGACASFASEWKQLRGAVQSAGDYRASRVSELRGCLSFSQANSGFTEKEMESLSDSELEGALRMCLEKRSEIESQFMASSQAKEIFSALEDSRQLLSELKSFPGKSVSQGDIAAYEIELEEISGNFSSEKALLSSAMILPEIQSQLFSARSELQKKLALALSEHAGKNSAVSISSDSMPIAGKESHFILRISVPSNSASQVNSDFSARIPVGKIPADSALYFKSGGIISAKPESDSVLIGFSGLSSQGERLEFRFASVPATFSEDLNPLFVSGENAVVESKLVLSVAAKIKSLLVPLKPFDSGILDLGRTKAYSEGGSLEIVSDSNSNFVSVPNPGDGQKISVYYFLVSPVSSELKQESVRNEPGSRAANYSLRISSRLAFPLNDFLFVLPVQPGEFAQITNVIDSKGLRPKLEMLSSSVGAVRIGELPAGQSLVVYFSLSISNAEAYYSGISAETGSILSSLSVSGNASIRSQAEALLEKLNALNFSSSGSAFQSGVTQLHLQAKSLEENQNGLASLSSEFLALSRKAKSEKLGLEEEAKKALEAGFPGLSSSLSAQASNIGLAIKSAETSSAGESGLQDAINALLKAMPEAESQSALSQKVASDKNSILAESLGLTESAKSLGISLAVEFLPENFVSLAEKTEYCLAGNDFACASASLRELRGKSDELRASFYSTVSKKISSRIESAESFLETADRAIPKKVSFLEGLFSSISEPDSANGFSVTLKYLSQARARLSAIASPSFRSKLSKIIGLANSAEKASALRETDSISAELEEKLSALNALGIELDEKTRLVSEDADSLLSQANAAVNLSSESTAKRKLADAKSALQKKDYLNSMLLSRSAISLATLSAKSESAFPLAVYPLLLVIAVTVIIKIRKRRPKSGPAPRKLERIGG